jgi:hypothetical protein
MTSRPSQYSAAIMGKILALMAKEDLRESSQSVEAKTPLARGERLSWRHEEKSVSPLRG